MHRRRVVFHPALVEHVGGVGAEIAADLDPFRPSRTTRCQSTRHSIVGDTFRHEAFGFAAGKELLMAHHPPETDATVPSRRPRARIPGDALRGPTSPATLTARADDAPGGLSAVEQANSFVTKSNRPSWKAAESACRLCSACRHAPLPVWRDPPRSILGTSRQCPRRLRSGRSPVNECADPLLWHSSWMAADKQALLLFSITCRQNFLSEAQRLPLQRGRHRNSRIA